MYSQAHIVQKEKVEIKGTKNMPDCLWQRLQAAIITVQKCSVSHKSCVPFSVFTENSYTQLWARSLLTELLHNEIAFWL